MLENALIVTSQVLILFLLIGIGFLSGKIKMVNASGIGQLTNILLVIVTPAIVIDAFQTEFDKTLVVGLLIALGSAFLSHLIGALIARFFFRKRSDDRSSVIQFAIVFSNCGFMSIPLLDAILGSTGVLYGSVYIAVFSVLQWTYGVKLMAGGKGEVNIKRALINPGTVSIAFALPLFLLQIELPQIPYVVVSSLAALNSPLAMFVIGAQLSFIKLASVFTDKDVIVSSLLRLFVVPFMVLFTLYLLPIEMDRVLILACLIPAAAPSAAGVALFATRHDRNALLATRTIALSTLLSIISLPVIILVTDLIKGY